MSLPRTDERIAELYEHHSKTVYRVCFASMKNSADTEDAAQISNSGNLRGIDIDKWQKNLYNETAVETAPSLRGI